MDASPAVQAIDQCDRIANKCGEITEEGLEFAESVLRKVNSMRTWIEEHGRVTSKQQAALDNMEFGVDAWLTEDDDEEIFH
jgi:G3E family GTPase